MNKNPSLIEAKVSQPGEDFLTESSKSPASMAFFCKTKSSQEKPESRRATDGTRTRDLHLGKVAYYQLYYYRISYLFCVPQNNNYYTTEIFLCQQFF